MAVQFSGTKEFAELESSSANIETLLFNWAYCFAIAGIRAEWKGFAIGLETSL
jgi:hypothetical protein